MASKTRKLCRYGTEDSTPLREYEEKQEGKFRKQFNSEEEHYQHIKANFHKVVKKRDKVFFMGDTAFTLERLQDISTWVCGRKVLICGNHDTDNLPMKVLSNLNLKL